MEELLVEVVCPATSKNYDFWIPKKMTVKNIIKKVTEDIMALEMNENLFDLSKEVLLFHYESRKVLSDEYTAIEAGIVTGNMLMIL
jgi:uncharacterized ubiquitin-like protein YukD